jgi:tetratricopeptide (TPR) repeat protein
MKHAQYILFTCLFAAITLSYTAIAQDKQGEVEEVSMGALTSNAQALQHFMKAEAFFEREKYKKAVKFYTLAYEADTSFITAIDNLALSYRRLYDMDKAIHFYTISLQKNIENRTVLNNLGLVYAYIEQYDKAIETYNTLLRIFPNCPQGNYNAGLTYLFAKNFEYAVQHADAAFQTWKESDKIKAQDAVYLVCRIHIAADNKDAAREYFREAARQGVRNNNARKDFGL